MSHFAVLVVTDSKPSAKDLARILLPWHEFECTGLDNKYVVDVDKTNEKDHLTWADQFHKMIESLPRDFWLTVVDCHI